MRQLTNSVRCAALPRATGAASRLPPLAGAHAPPARPQWVAKYRRNGSFTGRASYGCAPSATA